MGYIETALIFILAFIIIGPKDFPILMFRLGEALRRLKKSTQQFTAHFEQPPSDYSPQKIFSSLEEE